jgi:hypothetical protein
MTATSSPPTTADLATVTQLARQLRLDSIRASTSAGSGASDHNRLGETGCL